MNAMQFYMEAVAHEKECYNALTKAILSGDLDKIAEAQKAFNEAAEETVNRGLILN